MQDAFEIRKMRYRPLDLAIRRKQIRPRRVVAPVHSGGVVRGHRPRDVRSSSVRDRDRAPGPACRRQTNGRRHTRFCPAAHAMPRATSRRRRPFRRTSNVGDRRRGGKRSATADKEDPQVPNGPAYKELDNKNGENGPIGLSVVEGVVGSPAQERSCQDPARFDADIVALFDDHSEGWELLCVLPDEVLAQLRERQRRRELDASVLVELRLRYRHLLPDRRRT
jgi:hypothetical protein